MEGDRTPANSGSGRIPFQSTPSAWRETAQTHTGIIGGRNFNPLPPHGGRQNKIFVFFRPAVFQSTPSAWRETQARRRICERKFISIHSLRMEGDGDPGGLELPRNHFNPLPPHGGRQGVLCRVRALETFQSTPSAWRETL